MKVSFSSSAIMNHKATEEAGTELIHHLVFSSLVKIENKHQYVLQTHTNTNIWQRGLGYNQLMELVWLSF